MLRNYISRRRRTKCRCASATICANSFAHAYDNNGNITKYIDEGGNVVASYEYDDFGRTISQSGTMAEDFRIRFSTKYYDAEAGLYYYGYRFYSPALMRWLNSGPIEEGIATRISRTRVSQMWYNISNVN